MNDIKIRKAWGFSDGMNHAKRINSHLAPILGGSLKDWLYNHFDKVYARSFVKGYETVTPWPHF